MGIVSRKPSDIVKPNEMKRSTLYYNNNNPAEPFSTMEQR